MLRSVLNGIAPKFAERWVPKPRLPGACASDTARLWESWLIAKLSCPPSLFFGCAATADGGRGNGPPLFCYEAAVQFVEARWAKWQLCGVLRSQDLCDMAGAA